MNETTKPRLGTLRPGTKHLAFSLSTSDVIIGASDGLSLDTNAKRCGTDHAAPESMPEAILQAQRNSWHTVTLVCACDC
jgi:hypothetical protein